MFDAARLAPTPPMGWNSWDCYGAAVDEETLLANASYMRDHLAAHGWEYVVCDIQWSEPHADSTQYHPFARLTMDEWSRLLPAPERFPSGFAVIAEKIHAMGLKFGIHIMRGIPRQAVYLETGILGTPYKARDIARPFAECKWNTDMYAVDPDRPGAQEYYDSLLRLYASWGVDYIKADDIARADWSTDSYANCREIELLRSAIDRCGRPIVLSLSPGPAKPEAAWHLKHNANLWRITDDLWDDWRLVKAMFERCEVWQTHVAPGTWPDCDMLPLGRLCMFDHGGRMSRLTHEEQITLMNLWCIFRSPLMMGGELRENDGFTLSLLTNDDVLRLTKHSFGAVQIRRTAAEAVWTSYDEDGSRYAALFRLADEPGTVEVRTEEIGVPRTAKLRDLWAHRELGAAGAVIAAELPAHGSVLYRILSD